MAKKKKNKTKGRGPLWVPEPNDAIRLAAFRWFALEVERVSIEIYATDKSRFAAVEKIFRHMLGKLNTELAHAQELSDDGCPDGYIRCKDGTCAPACDGELPPDNES